MYLLGQPLLFVWLDRQSIILLIKMHVWVHVYSCFVSCQILIGPTITYMDWLVYLSVVCRVLVRAWWICGSSTMCTQLRCNLVTTLQPGRNNFKSKVLQGVHKLVATWSQSGGKVVSTWCYNLAARLPKPCHNLVFSAWVMLTAGTQVSTIPPTLY